MKARLQVAMTGVFALALTGCRHRQSAVYVPVPVGTTVPLEKAPEPPLVAQVPVEPGPPLPPKELPPKKVRRKKKAVPVVAAPVAPVEVASSGVAPAEAIGALTAGGDSSPAKLQEAADMVAGLEKRIALLPSEWKQKQKDGLVRVRYFESQAQVAIKGGDGEGAVTLATKARLLLEDLVK